MVKDTKTNDPIPGDLFDILACPKCKGNIQYTNNNKALYCKKCKIEYPIKDDVPILLTPQDRKRFKVKI